MAYNSPAVIVDFHTHVVPPSFRERRCEIVRRDATFRALFSDPKSRLATADDLVAAMDDAGVDVSVVMGFGWTDVDVAREANDYVIRSVERYPGRLVGFCSVNPAWGRDALAEVDRCAARGVAGIGELHPDSQGFDLADAELMAPLMDRARELGLVVLTHSSEPVGHAYPGKGKTTPEVLYAFARSFPDNTLVFAHWGGGLPFYTLMPEVGEALDRVYYDTAASPLLYSPRVFSAAAGLGITDRVLFGTDFPLIRHRRLLKEVEGASIEDSQREAVLCGNARRLLGL